MRITLATATTAAILATSITAAHATPEYIKSADFNKGKLELQYQWVTTTDSESSKKDHKVKHQSDILYSPADGWLLLAGGKGSRDSKDSTNLDSFFAGGAYQFIHEEDHGFNAAILTKYIHSVDSGDPDVLEGRLLLDKKWGEGKKIKTKANLNILREIGANRHAGITFQGRIGAVYKVKEYFQPGVEWHSELSTDDNAEHHVGPVVYGYAPEGSLLRGFGYEIGYLPGVSDSAADNAFRLLVSYKLKF